VLWRRFGSCCAVDREGEARSDIPCLWGGRGALAGSAEWRSLASPPVRAGGFCLPSAASAALLLQLLLRGESDVASGTVKWFNGQKGYGFIAPDGGGKDVFVHISAVEKAGLDGLIQQHRVLFR